MEDTLSSKKMSKSKKEIFREKVEKVKGAFKEILGKEWTEAQVREAAFNLKAQGMHAFFNPLSIQ